MPDRQTFLNQELVLRISPSVDPTRFDLTRYEPFLDALCGTREYQKEATRVTLRYLLGGRYTNLRSLAHVALMRRNLTAHMSVSDRGLADLRWPGERGQTPAARPSARNRRGTARRARTMPACAWPIAHGGSYPHGEVVRALSEPHPHTQTISCLEVRIQALWACSHSSPERDESPWLKFYGTIEIIAPPEL